MEYEIDVALKFPEPNVEVYGATLYLRLEDITYADAPAEVIAQEIVRNVYVHQSAPLRANLRVAQDRIQETALYSVRAHLDADGDGRVSLGDWVSTQVHPVLTRGNPTRAVIPLTMVRSTWHNGNIYNPRIHRLQISCCSRFFKAGQKDFI